MRLAFERRSVGTWRICRRPAWLAWQNVHGRHPHCSYVRCRPISDIQAARPNVGSWPQGARPLLAIEEQKRTFASTQASSQSVLNRTLVIVEIFMVDHDVAGMTGGVEQTRRGRELLVLAVEDIDGLISVTEDGYHWPRRVGAPGFRRPPPSARHSPDRPAHNVEARLRIILDARIASLRGRLVRPAAQPRQARRRRRLAMEAVRHDPYAALVAPSEKGIVSAVLQRLENDPRRVSTAACSARRRHSGL